MFRIDFAFPVIMGRQINSPNFVFAFVFGMMMLGTHSTIHNNRAHIQTNKIPESFCSNFCNPTEWKSQIPILLFCSYYFCEDGLQWHGHWTSKLSQTSKTNSSRDITSYSGPHSHRNQGTVERLHKTVYGQVWAIIIGFADHLGTHADQVDGRRLVWIIQHALPPDLPEISGDLAEHGRLWGNSAYPLTQNYYENNSLRFFFGIFEGNCTLKISRKEWFFFQKLCVKFVIFQKIFLNNFP